MERAEGTPLTVEEAKARLLAPDPRAPGPGLGCFSLARAPAPALLAGALVAGLLVGRLRGVAKLLTVGMIVARSPLGRAAAIGLARAAARRVSDRRAVATTPVRAGSEGWW